MILESFERVKFEVFEVLVLFEVVFIFHLILSCFFIFTCNVYLGILEGWLKSQLTEEEEQGFSFQQDRASSYRHTNVQEYLNRYMPGRWTGRATDADNIFCIWPERSLDLIICDFFLWGFVKDNVYIPSVLATLPELRRRITIAIENITSDVLARIWQELDYLLNICHITRGSHMEYI